MYIGFNIKINIKNSMTDSESLLWKIIQQHGGYILFLKLPPEKFKNLRELIKQQDPHMDPLKIDDHRIIIEQMWLSFILREFQVIGLPDVIVGDANPGQYICEDSSDSKTHIVFLMNWITYLMEIKKDETSTRTCTLCFDYLTAWCTLSQLSEQNIRAHQTGEIVTQANLLAWSNAKVANVALAVYYDSVETDTNVQRHMYIQRCLKHMNDVICKANLRVEMLSETHRVTPDETPRVTPDETPCVTPDESSCVTPDEAQRVTHRMKRSA
jgi:hypothetical protein